MKKLVSQQSVSVVIPTYNGRQLLEKNLPAVVACLRSGDEIIIVDDASSDDTIEWLRQFETKGLKKNSEKKIKLTVYRNSTNLRFAKSCNRGVELAKYQLIFLLNNDVSPHLNVLKYLVPYFDHDLVFAVGCLEMELAQNVKKNGNRQTKPLKGGKNKLWFKRGLFVHSRADDFSSGQTGWVSGGSGLFSKRKWLKLRGFDPDYFPAYWEDIDLSYRARKKGWQILFEEKAIVDHNHSSTNQDVFGQGQIEIDSFKNSFHFLWKNGSVLHKLLFLSWLPYHLWFTNSKTKGRFLTGLRLFLSGGA